MILSNQMADSRFGGSGGPLEPVQDDKPLQPKIDLRPFLQRWGLMRLEYMSKWYQRHRDVSRYINPKRGFFEGFVPNYNQQYDYKLVIDDNPAYYAGVYASGMQSGLTNQSERWFRLGIGVPDPDLQEQEDVKFWLERAEEILRDIFERSNWYEATHQTYEELGLFGTGSFGIFEDYRTVIRCRGYTVGEYYLATDAMGRPSGFARQFWMTVDQIVEEYGFKNCSEKIQALYRAGNRDTYVLVYTLCEKNSTRIPNLADFRGMEYRSVTWEATQGNTDRPLRCAGHHEFPYMCPRGRRTTTADIYGTSPGFDSLGNIKMLYRMQKDSLLAINKVADPPVQVDATVEGVPNMLPGGVTRSNSAAVPNAGVRPSYQVNPDIKAIEEKIDRTDKKIAARFFVDLFMMMINSPEQDRTAREIVERHEEKLFMLGPVINSVKNDMLDPSIDRVFNIAMRAGLIPPPPPSIQGLPLKVEYISMLALAQKMAGVQAIEQEASFVGTLAAAFPEAKDNFDPDEAVRAHSSMIGTPSKIIRSPDAVAAIRKARAQQAAEAQQQQEAMAAVQGAGVLAKSRVGKGNALEQMMGVEPSGDQPGGNA